MLALVHIGAAVSEDVTTNRLFAIQYNITSLASTRKGHPFQVFDHGCHTAALKVVAL